MEQLLEEYFDHWSVGLPTSSWIRLRLSTMWERLAARERGEI